MDFTILHQLTPRILLQVIFLTVLLVIAEAYKQIDKEQSAKNNDINKEQTEFDKITLGTNNFAINLYRAVASKQTGNVFVSPLSAQMVLSLAYIGARGQTANELATLLALPDKTEDFRTGYHSLVKVLQTPSVNLANRMFVEKTVRVKDDFEKNANWIFDSATESLDFLSASDQSRKRINSWVESQTNKKITNLLEPGMITSDTRLVLVNVIYLKVNWRFKFNERHTKDELFHVSKTKTARVKMMHTKKSFNYGYDEELKSKIVELEYEGNGSMIIILPDDIGGLTELEANLQNVNVFEKLKYFRKQRVHVALPKFKIEKTIELNDILKSLGVRAMFDINADFSGISDQPLYVSEVVQTAFVEVSEKGTEAGAASGVRFVALSATPTFTADRPFLFIITTGRSSLFVGRVVEPLFN